MERAEIEAHLEQCRLQLNQIGVTGLTWMGITVSWKRLAKRDGGTSKRNGAYGRYAYEYRGEDLTLEEAINEISKPPSLRQALIEAEAAIECSMCGKVVVGEEALSPYMSIVYRHGQRYEKQPWGLIFWKMVDGEPEYLNFCPACLEAIGNGEYKER